MALLVYDVTNTDSVEVLKAWIKELKEYGPAKLVLAIAGNKIDLVNETTVSFVEIAEYAKVRVNRIMLN